MNHFGTFNSKDLLENRLTKLLGTNYPIIQAGMIWASGWRLAAAVSNAGGLGVIGAGSMYPAILEEHLQKIQLATNKPFAVNLPLLYPNIAEHIELIIKYKVPIVISSAGNPKTWTPKLKEAGIKVLHVVSSAKFALKCQEAGVDAVIAEGFEAGGHNGREETTTLCLIPAVRKVLNIPLIAAGGIGSGAAMLACMVLGAEGVQVGSRFLCTPEASSHESFKQAILKAGEGDTELVLKQLTPVRLLKNPFYQAVKAAENHCESTESLQTLLGRGRAKKGMFEGDMIDGELEVGQVSATINTIMPAADVLTEIWTEFRSGCRFLGGLH
ncbi:MAG: nitronate monooxygenase [Chitinophagaceae bacterium]|nr:nitronate monooxygenase [Chitinophagaceae bacterium]